MQSVSNLSLPANSLVTGKLTGNFAKPGFSLQFKRSVNERNQQLTAEFPARWNRESSNRHQGTYVDEQRNYITDYPIGVAGASPSFSVDPTFASLSTLLQRRLTSSVDIQLQLGGVPGGRRMKGSDLLVAALENQGVERIFAGPGEEISRSSSRSAGPAQAHWDAPRAGRLFLVATQSARLTRRPGVCCIARSGDAEPARALPMARCGNLYH